MRLGQRLGQEDAVNATCRGAGDHIDHEAGGAGIGGQAGRDVGPNIGRAVGPQPQLRCVAREKFGITGQKRQPAVDLAGAAVGAAVARCLAVFERRCAGHLENLITHAVDVDGQRYAPIHDDAEAHFRVVARRQDGRLHHGYLP